MASSGAAKWAHGLLSCPLAPCVHIYHFFENYFSRVPTNVIYLALSLMQKWSANLKEKDKKRIFQVKDSIMRCLKGFKPSITMLLDVVEI